MVQLTHQVAIPGVGLAPIRTGRGGRNPGRWADRLIGRVRLLEQGRLIRVIVQGCILMPMRRVIEVPPRRGMTGMLRKTGHLARVVDADALRRIILMHLLRVIGQRDRHLRKTHKLVIVVAQIVRVILVAPVEARHTIATLLRGQRITQLIGIVGRAIDGSGGLNASLPVLHEPVRRVLFRTNTTWLQL